MNTDWPWREDESGGVLLRIRVLGPIAVRRDDSWERVRTPKLQALLARLVVSAGTPVSVDSLIDELWPDSAPETATNQVHGYVSRLRKLVPAGTLVGTRSAGYELVLGATDTDAMVFERLADDGRAALENGHAEDAAPELRHALDLWDGPALGNPLRGPARIEADRLDELRSVVHEAWADAEIRRGRPAAELVAELRAMVDVEPLREHRWELLLRALHDSGRTAEALAAYRRVYRLLRQELGVSPGAGLTAVHARILDERSRVVAAPRPRPAPDDTQPVVPRQLPALVSAFTGRRIELTAITDWIIAARKRTSVEPSALLLFGGGGIGKTALAVQAAHSIADLFPDGQIHLDLQGFSSGRPLRPRQAIVHCLRALGVPPDRVPTDNGQAIGLYRTVLAERRVLLVLDNAADADQLGPLLPPRGSIALATSRHTMSGLAAAGRVRRHPIAPMTEADTRDLLIRLVGSWQANEEREAVDALASACAGLPLATRIAATNLAGEARGSVRYALRALSDSPLAFLRTDDADDSHPETSLTATYALSYRRLAQPVARAFRLIGLSGTDELTLRTAASLLDRPEAETRRLLAALCDGGLLERAARDQYRIHPLLLAYARACHSSTPDLATSTPFRTGA